MPTDPLSLILDEAATDPGQLRRDGLEAIARAVTGLPADEFIQAAVLAPALSWDDGISRPPGYLEIHSGQWWIDTSDPGNRRHLIVACAAAALVDALDIRFSVDWVTRVFPQALVVVSVSSSRPHAGLLFRLRRAPTAGLSPALAEFVNQDDYADFVGMLRHATGIAPTTVAAAVEFITT